MSNEEQQEQSTIDILIDQLPEQFPAAVDMIKYDIAPHLIACNPGVRDHYIKVIKKRTNAASIKSVSLLIDEAIEEMNASVAGNDSCAAIETTIDPEIIEASEQIAHDPLLFRKKIDVVNQLGLRPVLHDLIDPPGGYIDGAQFEFFDAAVRYYLSDNRLVLEYLDFVDIVSIPTRTRFIKPFSWKGNVGLERMLFDDDDRPITGQGNFGAGVSYYFLQDATISLFAEAMMVISDRFDEKLALGAGPSCGIIFELTEQWRMAFFARSLAFMLGSTNLTYDIALEQAIDLTPQSSLRILISRCQEFGSPYNSVSAGYLVYF